MWRLFSGTEFISFAGRCALIFRRCSFVRMDAVDFPDCLVVDSSTRLSLSSDYRCIVGSGNRIGHHSFGITQKNWSVQIKNPVYSRERDENKNWYIHGFCFCFQVRCVKLFRSVVLNRLYLLLLLCGCDIRHACRMHINDVCLRLSACAWKVCVPTVIEMV